jgi:hypothetical protein
MAVDQMLDGARRAALAVGRQIQPRQRVSGNVFVMRAQFAPGDRTILVVVKPDRIVEVAQRDIPLAADLACRGLQREVAVARLVRQCRLRVPTASAAASAARHVFARSRLAG